MDQKEVADKPRRQKVLIGSQRDEANPALSPTKPEPVVRAQTEPVRIKPVASAPQDIDPNEGQSPPEPSGEAIAANSEDATSKAPSDAVQASYQHSSDQQSDQQSNQGLTVQATESYRDPPANVGQTNLTASGAPTVQAEPSAATDSTQSHADAAVDRTDFADHEDSVDHPVATSTALESSEDADIVSADTVSLEPVSLDSASDDSLLAQLPDDSAMAQLMSADAQVITEPQIDERLHGVIARIHGEHVFITLKGRYEAIASLRQFKKPPEPGTGLEVIVTGYNDDDGLFEVTIPGAAVDVADWSDLKEGSIVEARVTGANTGGLEVRVGTLRGFIPASQIEIFRVENLGDYVNKKLSCVVTEARQQKRRLVLSHRAIAEREQEAKRRGLLESIQPGETRDGVVTRLQDFGAFVDIGGVEGLVHVSKLSWDRVEHPNEVLSEGQRIAVKVEKVNHANGKISLSYRDTLQNPWFAIEEKYPVESVVHGTVSRVAQFGAFVKLEPGVEGLIHVSQLAHHRVFAVQNVVKVGDEVDVKVLSVDAEAQKISLSLKATQPKPEPKAREGQAKDDEQLPETGAPIAAAAANALV